MFRYIVFVVFLAAAVAGAAAVVSWLIRWRIEVARVQAEEFQRREGVAAKKTIRKLKRGG